MELTDEDLKRMVAGADLGEEKARALAKRLTRETRKKYCVKSCHYTGLVGGSDWWEVCEVRYYIFHVEIASFWSPDGEERSCFV